MNMDNKIFTIILGLSILVLYICNVKLNKYNIMGKAIDFSEVTLRTKITTRGGGIEIDLTRFGFRGEKMSAYQNSLGGGMLGSIAVNDTIRAFDKDCTVKQGEKLDRIGLRLQKHFFTLVNGEFDKEAFKELQCRSVSAY